MLAACGDAATGPDAEVTASDASPGATDARAQDAAGAPALDAAALDAAALDALVAPMDAATSEDAGMPREPDAPASSDAPVVGPPAPEGCFTTVAPGHHVFPCDGISYDVEISSECAGGGCGLIFDVHGATMDAASEDRNTNLRALGSAAGYVVVQPTAPPGSGALSGPAWDPVRDDPKVLAFLLLTSRALRVDPDRVHFTGFSQGGFMTWRMLCDHAEIFASMAPAAACGGLFRGCSFAGTDRPSREVPVLYIHGSRDTIVSGCGPSQRDLVITGWSMRMDSVLSSDADHSWTRYLSPGGTAFEFIGHDYSAYSYVLSGHCLPGSRDIGTSRFGTSGYGCDDDSPVSWGEAVLAFFQAHPRG